MVTRKKNNQTKGKVFSKKLREHGMSKNYGKNRKPGKTQKGGRNWRKKKSLSKKKQKIEQVGGADVTSSVRDYTRYPGNFFQFLASKKKDYCRKKDDWLKAFWAHSTISGKEPIQTQIEKQLNTERGSLTQGKLLDIVKPILEEFKLFKPLKRNSRASGRQLIMSDKQIKTAISRKKDLTQILDNLISQFIRNINKVAAFLCIIEMRIVGKLENVKIGSLDKDPIFSESGQIFESEWGLQGAREKKIIDEVMTGWLTLIGTYNYKGRIYPDTGKAVLESSLCDRVKTIPAQVGVQTMYDHQLTIRYHLKQMTWDTEHETVFQTTLFETLLNVPLMHGRNRGVIYFQNDQMFFKRKPRERVHRDLQRQRQIFNKLLAESDLGINDLKKTELGRGSLAVAAGINNLVYKDSLHTQNLGAMLALACAYKKKVFNFKDAMDKYGKFVWNAFTGKGIRRFKNTNFTAIQDSYISSENVIAINYIDYLLELIKRGEEGGEDGNDPMPDETGYTLVLQNAFEEVLKMNYYQYGLLKNEKYYCIFCCQVFNVLETGAFEIEHMWGTLPGALGRILHLFFTNCPICPKCNKKTPRDTEYITKYKGGELDAMSPFWHPIFKEAVKPDGTPSLQPDGTPSLSFVGVNEFKFPCDFGRNIFSAYAIVVCGYYKFLTKQQAGLLWTRNQAAPLWTAACVKTWLGEPSERVALDTVDDGQILVPSNLHSRVFIKGIYQALRELTHDCGPGGQLAGNLECRNILELQNSLAILSTSEEFVDLTKETFGLSSNSTTVHAPPDNRSQNTRDRLAGLLSKGTQNIRDVDHFVVEEVAEVVERKYKLAIMCFETWKHPGKIGDFISKMQEDELKEIDKLVGASGHGGFGGGGYSGPKVSATTPDEDLYHYRLEAYKSYLRP